MIAGEPLIVDGSEKSECILDYSQDSQNPIIKEQYPFVIDPSLDIYFSGKI